MRTQTHSQREIQAKRCNPLGSSNAFVKQRHDRYITWPCWVLVWRARQVWAGRAGSAPSQAPVIARYPGRAMATSRLSHGWQRTKQRASTWQTIGRPWHVGTYGRHPRLRQAPRRRQGNAKAAAGQCDWVAQLVCMSVQPAQLASRAAVTDLCQHRIGNTVIHAMYLTCPPPHECQ